MTLAPGGDTLFWLLVFLSGVAVGIGILIVGFAVYARQNRETAGFDVTPRQRNEPEEPLDG